jgi:TonB family protein
MSLRQSVTFSSIVHGSVLAVLFIARASDPLMISGPDVVQVSLIEPGALPAARAAPPPAREQLTAPSEPEEGVKIEPQKKKKAKQEPEPEDTKTETNRAPEPIAGPATPALPSAAAGPAGLTGEASVDAADFEFTYYLIQVRNKIAQNWGALGATSGEKLRVVVYFKIARNGGVSAIRIETPSGSEYFDRSALRAVGVSSPLPPLPLGFNGSDLGVHFGFEYQQP